MEQRKLSDQANTLVDLSKVRHTYTLVRHTAIVQISNSYLACLCPPKYRTTFLHFSADLPVYVALCLLATNGTSVKTGMTE